MAARVRAEVAASAAALRGRGIAPTLAVVLVGDDPASAVYVRTKTKAAREAGVDVAITSCRPTSQAELLALVRSLCDDPRRRDPGPDAAAAPPRQRRGDPHAPSGQGRRRPDRDEPGLPRAGPAALHPVHPEGLHAAAPEIGVTLAGVRAVVLGRSLLVGKPIALLLRPRTPP